jgi:uncharacterized protein (DUF608 family)
LEFIGMPVGGITSGQLYLGGDGKLWHWDVFNQITPTGDQHYAQPPPPLSSIDQDFAVRIFNGAQSEARPLSSHGFADINFRGEYPIGHVEYRDPGCPLTIDLEAFSPFVPLNLEDSSLPATIMRFTLLNTGANAVAGELTGCLENGVARSAESDRKVTRVNAVSRCKNGLFVSCSADLSNPENCVDAGTMGLVLLESTEDDVGIASIDGRSQQRPAGSLTRKFSLKPGQSLAVSFAIVWCFPNLRMGGIKGGIGRHYATRFDSAPAVARYLAANIERLYSQTKLWCDTWYAESTLPHWLLERTLLNVSTLATSTAYRFADGRFYGWEGVGCCPGTCTHVWHYEQAMGRLFPQLDVLLRERAEFNPDVSFGLDGMINFRGEVRGGGFLNGPAVDGQAGTILRALRDHQTSPDGAFMKRNWLAIKKATQWLISQDKNADGILEGRQHNTLDTPWYGPVAWLSGLYLAALRAAEEMAIDAGDSDFARQCRQIFERGQKNIVARLFEGEYFINRPNPNHPEAINSGTGCEIDQVLGQSWAFQVGLGRVFPVKETLSALASLWRYNFTPDVGPYREVNQPGRWYAMPGEAGLLMCTFPRADWDFGKAKGTGKDSMEAGYFNECMNGFEHQVAGHMIWEGMVTEGLAIERAIHDRYHAARRNPWNEVECGDHYARSMASYGVFIAACGFEYHGPKAHIGFAPRLQPGDFKSAFTAAEGWGSFTQTIQDGVLTAKIDVLWGRLRVRTLSLAASPQHPPTKAIVTLNGQPITAELTVTEGRANIRLREDALVEESGRLGVKLS